MEIGFPSSGITADPFVLPNARRSYVATRCGTPFALNAAYTQFMSRTAHFASDDITSIEAIFANFWINQSASAGTRAETGPGAAATVTASIEYPLGVFTRMTFGGANSGTIANGGVLSGLATVAIPRGALFWVRSWRECASGCPYANTGDPAPHLGEVSGYGATAADITMTNGGFTGSSGTAVTGNLHRPIALVGMTNRRTIAIIPDSRDCGQSDNPDEWGNVGFTARAIGTRMGFTKLGVPGYSLVEMVTNASANLQAIGQLASDVMIQLGFNDANRSRSAAQIAADYATVAAYFPNATIWTQTMPPGGGSSTDNWATVANQTVATTKAVQDTENARRRALANCFDVSSRLSAGGTDGSVLKDSGKHLTHHSGTVARWATTDGVHGTPFSYAEGAKAIRFG